MYFIWHITIVCIGEVAHVYCTAHQNMAYVALIQDRNRKIKIMRLKASESS